MLFLTDEKELKITSFMTIFYFYVMRDPFHPKMLTSLKKIEKLYPKISFVAVDIDQFSNVIKRFELETTPTIILYKKGKERKRVMKPFNNALTCIFVDIEKGNASQQQLLEKNNDHQEN
jgi:thiol-disulfide isomerase/thioredoxin